MMTERPHTPAFYYVARVPRRSSVERGRVRCSGAWRQSASRLVLVGEISGGRADRLLLRAAGSKTILVDVETPDLRFERRSCNAQPGGRARWAEHAPAARTQGVFDDRSLVAGD